MSDEQEKGSEKIVLNQRFEIFPSRLLADFGTNSAKAYFASDLKDQASSYFALICGVNPAPRLDEIKTFMSLVNTGSFLVPQAYGPVYWPLSHGKQLALIFPRPLGGPVMTSASPKKISEPDILGFLGRIANLFQEMFSLKVVHRSIRAENLFFLDESQTTLILGECLSAPAGYNQSPLYETPYRAMASPYARGSGDISDDLYALGVTTLMLALGKNPVKSLTASEILRKKIREGSYGALVGSFSREINPSINEFLRGVLVDDPKERWTLEQMILWLEGKRSSPKQFTKFPVASRAFRFREEEYFTPQELSYEMSQNWQETLKILSKPDFISAWVKRNLNKDEEAQKIETLVGQLNRIASGKINEQHRLISLILMTLSPNSPIFWGKNIYMADGLATALVNDIVQGSGGQSGVIPVIKERLISQWVNLQNPVTSRLSNLEEKFDSLSFFIDNPVIGYGIERCLYHLNPGLPCLSPLIIHGYVYNLADLLPALNKTISSNPDIKEIFDRHLIAFIATRLPNLTQADLEILSHADPSKVSLGRLNLFKQIQSATKGGIFPELVQWFVKNSEPVLETYGSLNLREKIKKDLEAEMDSGDLNKIMSLLNNPSAREKDKQEFSKAQEEYKNLDTMIKEIDKKYVSDMESILSLGRTITSGFSMIAGSLSLLFIGIYFFGRIF